MNMTEILKSAVERGASDIFVVAGLPLTYKVRGEQQRETADGAFTPEKTEAFAAEIYRLAAREPHCLNGGLVSRRVFNRFQKEYPKSGAAYTFKSLDLRHIHMSAEEKATEKTERRKA